MEMVLYISATDLCCNMKLMFLFEEAEEQKDSIKLLKTKRNLPYIRNQSVPRSKHFPPRL